VTKLLHDAQETWQTLSIGRSTFYELVAKGDIKVVKIGRRTLVAHEELERYVASLPARPVTAEAS
jgi:excisionase family DNA binding protein